MIKSGTYKIPCTQPKGGYWEFTINDMYALGTYKDTLHIDKYSGKIRRVNNCKKVTINGAVGETWTDQNTVFAYPKENTYSFASQLLYGRKQTGTADNLFTALDISTRFVRAAKHVQNTDPTDDYECFNSHYSISYSQHAYVRIYKSRLPGVGDLLTEFKDWLSKNPFDVIYPLATPVTSYITTTWKSTSTATDMPASVIVTTKSPDYPRSLVPVAGDVKNNGRNLIPYPYSNGAQYTTIGITSTVNPDRSVTSIGTTNGQYSALYRFAKNIILTPGTYTLAYDGELTNGINIYTQIDILYPLVSKIIKNVSFNVSKTTAINIWLQSDAVGTAVNQTVRPYLVKGSYTAETIPPYQPYQSPSTFTTPTLRAIKDDSNNIVCSDKLENNVLINGERKAKFTQNVGYIVFDGSVDEPWTIDEDNSLIQSGYMVYTRLLFGGVPPASSMSSCNAIRWVYYGYSSSSSGTCQSFTSGGNSWRIKLQNTLLSNTTPTVADLRTYLANNPLTLFYKLATPIITYLDPITNMSVYPNYTFISSDSEVHPIITTHYISNKDASDTQSLASSDVVIGPQPKYPIPITDRVLTGPYKVPCTSPGMGGFYEFTLPHNLRGINNTKDIIYIDQHTGKVDLVSKCENLLLDGSKQLSKTSYTTGSNYALYSKGLSSFNGLANAIDRDDLLTSHFINDKDMDTSNLSSTNMMASESTLYVSVPNADYPTNQSLGDWMSNNNVDVRYKLKDPVTITLPTTWKSTSTATTFPYMVTDTNKQSAKAKVCVHGKNMFNIEDVYETTYCTRKDNGFISNIPIGVPYSEFGIYNNKMNLIPGKTYTYSFKSYNVLSSKFISIVLFGLRKNKNYSYETSILGNKLTFTIPDDFVWVGKIAFRFNRLGRYTVADNFTYIYDIQVEPGDQATEYVPYNGKTIDIDLPHPLRKCGRYADYIDFRTGKLISKVNALELTGGFTQLSACTGGYWYVKNNIFNDAQRSAYSQNSFSVYSNKLTRLVSEPLITSPINNFVFHNNGVGDNYLAISSSITTADEFNDWLLTLKNTNDDPLVIYYPLLNETSTPATLPDIYIDNGNNTHDEMYVDVLDYNNYDILPTEVEATYYHNDHITYSFQGNTLQDSDSYVVGASSMSSQVETTQTATNKLGNVIIPFIIGNDSKIDMEITNTTNGWWLIGGLRHDVSRLQTSGLEENSIVYFIADAVSDNTSITSNGVSQNTIINLEYLQGYATKDLYLKNCPNAVGVYNPLTTVSYNSGYKYIYLNGTAQTTAEVDETLNNLAGTHALVTNGANGIIYMNARTSASDDAVTKLQGLGWNVLCTNATNVQGAAFTRASVDSNSDGLRIADSVGKSVTISSDAVAGSSDFDSHPAFACVRVNGYVGEDGEFVESAIEGMDSSFKVDGTNGDVWSRFNKSFFKYDFSDPNYESIYISDNYVPDEGWCPFQMFIKPNNTLRDYGYIACYEAGYGSDGKLASISGIPVYTKNASDGTTGLSHNGQLTEFRNKGNQYCGMTTKEVGLLTELFKVEFNTVDSDSVLPGCQSYYLYYKATVAETGVKRIIISNSNASNLLVGSTISIGTTNVANSSHEPVYSEPESIVSRKKILSIETYDTNNKSINIDTIDTFNTDTVDTWIVTLQWYAGSTDIVLGHTGQINGKNTKTSMKYRHVENLYGNAHTILSDAIFKDYVIYQCNDVTKFTASAPTADYSSLSYSLPTEIAYTNELGYDIKSNTRFTTSISATSALSKYKDRYSQNGVGIREILYGGALNAGSNNGCFCFGVGAGLGSAYWYIAGRLSSCGSCGTTA